MAFCWSISDIPGDDSLIVFVHFRPGLPGSRLFKMAFPDSRFVKSPNPVSRSKLQSRISFLFFSKIPNPGLQISHIPDPEKPIGDPPALLTSHTSAAAVYLPYPRRPESLTICRCHYKGNTFSSDIIKNLSVGPLARESGSLQTQ